MRLEIGLMNMLRGKRVLENVIGIAKSLLRHPREPRRHANRHC